MTKHGPYSRHFYNIVKILMVVMLSLLMAFGWVTTIGFDVAYAADEPDINAEAAIVISGSTGEVIYDFHSERKLSFSGIEKLMIAMIVIDNMESPDDLNKKVEIPKTASKYGDMFSTGENVTVKDLLNAMLLTNSSEASVALAIYSCGSTTSCVNQMNAKAQQMRLMETRFMNNSGKYDKEKYITAKNAAEIVRAAHEYDLINSILSQPRYKMAETEKHNSRIITNSNPLMEGPSKYSGAHSGLVSQTSSTSDVSTYVGTAYVDDMNIIVIMMNEDSDYVASDAKELFDYGYAHVTKKVIVKSDLQEGVVKVRCGEKTRVPAYTARKGYVYIPPEGSDELVTTKVVLFNGIRAPLEAGDKVGEYEIYVAGEKKGKVDLVVKEDVAVGWFPSYLYISNDAAIVLAALTGVILLVLIITVLVRRSRRKKREARRKERIRQEALRQKAIEDDRARRNWTYR